MKYCPECGVELPTENAVICVKCGAAIKKEDSLVSSWSNGTKIVLYLLAVFIPIIGLIAGITGLNNENNKQTGLIVIGLSLFSWFISAIIISTLLGGF